MINSAPKSLRKLAQKNENVVNKYNRIIQKEKPKFGLANFMFELYLLDLNNSSLSFFMSEYRNTEEYMNRNLKWASIIDKDYTSIL